MGDFDFDGDFDLKEKDLDIDLPDTENPDSWDDPLQYGSEYSEDEFDSLDNWDEEEY